MIICRYYKTEGKGYLGGYFLFTWSLYNQCHCYKYKFCYEPIEDEL